MSKSTDLEKFRVDDKTGFDCVPFYWYNVYFVYFWLIRYFTERKFRGESLAGRKKREEVKTANNVKQNGSKFVRIWEKNMKI